MKRSSNKSLFSLGELTAVPESIRSEIHFSYREYEPSQALSPYVEAFWTLHREEGAPTVGNDGIFPHRGVDLLLNLGPNPVELSINHRHYSFSHCMFVGPRLHKLCLNPAAPLRLFGVRFFPYALFSLTGYQPERVVDELFEPTVLGLRADWLESANLHVLSPEYLSLFLDKHLEEWFRDHRNPVLVEAVVKAIDQRKGLVAIHELTRQFGIHKSTLEDHFQRYIGLNPKRYARIIRFNTLLAFLSTSGFGELLTDTAYQLNFSDQAHMIKEFKSMAGVPPRKFLRENGQLWKINQLMALKRIDRQRQLPPVS